MRLKACVVCLYRKRAASVRFRGLADNARFAQIGRILCCLREDASRICYQTYWAHQRQHGSAQVFRAIKKHLAADETYSNARVAVTPDAIACGQDIVTGVWFAQNFLDFIVGHAALELIVLLGGDLAAADQQKSEKQGREESFHGWPTFCLGLYIIRQGVAPS